MRMLKLTIVGLVFAIGLLPAGGQAANSYRPASDLIGDSLKAVSLPGGASVGWWAAVQEDIGRSEYQVTWQDRTHLPDLPAESPRFRIPAAYQAPNQAHNLRTYFTPTGVQVIPRTGEGAWEWGLRLTGHGYEGAIQPAGPATLRTDGRRIEYRRGDLTEWYVNDHRGLEQGFTLYARPPGAHGRAPLQLQLELTGNLTPTLTGDGLAIDLASEFGVRVLRYGGLYAEDATGRGLPAHLAVEPSGISLLVDDSTAIYPIIVDPLVTSPSWTAESDQANAEFGWSVGTAGDVNGDGAPRSA